MTSPAPRARDAVANVLSFAASVVIAVLFTPYLVSGLGVANFGLVPLATGVTQYLSVLTIAIQGALSRNVVAALSTGDEHGANTVWNTAIKATTIVTAVALPLALVASSWSPRVLNAPPGSEGELVMLVMMTTLAFFTTTYAAIYEVGIYATSRFDLRALVLVSSVITRVLVVVVLFELLEPTLWHIGAGILAAAFVQLLLSWWMCQRVTPRLRVGRGLFSGAILRELCSLGSWVVINHVGALLFLNASIIVVNISLGPTASGEYGLVNAWVNLVVAVGSAIAAVFGPQVLSVVAQGDSAQTLRVVTQANRIVAVAMAVPIGLVTGFGRPLMVAWQGPDFGHLGPLLAVAVFGFSITLSVQPMNCIFLATGRVRLPGVVSLVSGAVSVGLGYVLAEHTSLGIYGPAITTTVTLALAAILFTVPYGAALMNASPRVFLGSSLLGGLCAGAVAGLAFLADYVFAPDSWIGLTPCAIAVCVAVTPVGVRFVLREEERRMIWSRLRRSA